MKAKLSLHHVLLYLALMLCLVIIFQQFTKNNDLKKENHSLNVNLEKSKETSLITALTKQFIEKTTTGDQKSMLSPEATAKLEQDIKNQGQSTEGSDNLLENVEVLNCFAKKISDNTAISYGIYKLNYKYNENQPSSSGIKRYIILTVIIDWQKIKDTYKVQTYHISLLKDSLDDYLKNIQQGSGQE